MQRLARLTVAVALISPAVASGQDDTFFDWANDQRYAASDAMLNDGYANDSSPAISGLSVIGEFNWTTSPTITLGLRSIGTSQEII